MKILNKMKFTLTSLLIIFMQFIFIPVPKVHAYSNPAAVPLGTVSNFAALGHTTVTSPIGGTVLNNGNMGTNADCTGFPSPCLSPGTAIINNGVIHQADGVATTGQTDATAAVTNIGGRSSDETLATQLGGQTLTQGVYTVAEDPTSNLTGDLTLHGDANAVFIFHLTSTLVTSTGSRVLLTGGAQACNVFWKVDSSATFNDTTKFVGTVLASASVSFPGGGATLDGRVVAQTGAVTFNNTTVNNSSCAAASSSSSSSSSGGSASAPAAKVCPSLSCVTPIILESRRVSPTSIFLSWGPYAGLKTFVIYYGLTNGNWLYNTTVTGFSTTINLLPANQPIWVLIQPTDSCSVGTCGVAKLVGGPKLPNTGFAPRENNISWYIPAGIFVGISVSLVFIQRKHIFSSR